MKIMFCLGSMRKGGAERVVANLSNAFSKNHDVNIVVTIPGESMYELNDNIKYFSLDKCNKKNNFISRTISRIFRLRKIIKEINPDVIVSLLPEPTYRLMIAKIFLDKKTIISVRNDPNVEYNTFFKKMLVKLLYTKADGFVFQTEDAKKWFSKKIQDKSTVIPNPINENFICEPYDGEREKTIVTVGRLNVQKNQKLLIDAFYEVSKIYEDYILKIYGSGPLQENLQNQINRLNLNDKVTLMGQSDNIKQEIYKAGMFVLSSDYEGMPNALMEAMALGLPCISTDCPIGGSKYLIKSGVNGLLTPVNDKEKLTKSIIKMIEDKQMTQRISENANKISLKFGRNQKW